MVDDQSTGLAQAITSLLSDEWISDQAGKLTVIKRQRKIDPVVLVWTLALGFTAGAKKTLASLRRAFEKNTGLSIAASSWRERFTPDLVVLMRACALQALSRLAEKYSGSIAENLRGFREVLALDATVLRLAKGLADKFPASRTNHTEAAAKLHMMINVVDTTPRRLKICPESQSDQAAWRRLGGWIKDCLLMFDLGYYDFNLFRRIERQGGFFLTRLKVNANPLIVAVNDHGPGARRNLVGQTLQEALVGLQRKIISVTARFTVKIHVYRGVQQTHMCDWRVIAVRNDETGRYHLYATNVPNDQLQDGEVSEMYRLRWQVEIFFKMMKTHGRIHHLGCKNNAAVEALIWGAILAVVTSMKILQLVRLHNPGRRTPALRFQEVFGTIAGDLHKEIAARRSHKPKRDLFDFLLREADDPNQSRITSFNILDFS